MATAGWGWKLASEPDEVINFLNGSPPFEHPVGEAHVTALWNGDYVAFHIFYRPGEPGQPPGTWGWKLAADPDDAKNFLNGTGPYCQPPEEAQVMAVWKHDRLQFYIFYTYELVPARIVDCQILQTAAAAPGFERMRLGWTYCEGQRPERVSITAMRSEGSHWVNIMPDGQAASIRGGHVTAADVMIVKLQKGPHKIVFCAHYPDHEELEYTFDRLI